jgi:superfamily I DNA and/or RNA helicase
MSSLRMRPLLWLLKLLWISEQNNASCGPGAKWIDCYGTSHDLLSDDILIVTPYNAQVSQLAERNALRRIRVGTVDRFQGQEAPVIIYSMATSTPEDAPRGMEFLYNLNRLNVATSRAKCAAILVASPRLFEPDCKSARQIDTSNFHGKCLSELTINS